MLDRLNQFVELTIIFINSISLPLIVWVWLPSCLQVNLHQNYNRQLVPIFRNYMCWERKKKLEKVCCRVLSSSSKKLLQKQGEVRSHSDLSRRCRDRAAPAPRRGPHPLPGRAVLPAGPGPAFPHPLLLLLLPEKDPGAGPEISDWAEIFSNPPDPLRNGVQDGHTSNVAE